MKRWTSANSPLKRAERVAMKLLFEELTGVESGTVRAEATFDRLGSFLDSLERPRIALPIRVALTLLGWGGWLFGHREGAPLAAKHRKDFLHAVLDDESPLNRLATFLRSHGTTVPHPRSVLAGLRSLIVIAYYSDPATDSETLHEALWKRAEVLQVMPEIQPPPAVIDVLAIARKRVEGSHTPNERLFRNDGRARIAVIGSGAGGAVIAAQLAGRYDVAVFEAGPRFSPAQFPIETLSGMSLLFEDGLLTPTRGLDLQVLRGRLIGGGTALSSGMSMRPRDATLRHWQARGISIAEVQRGLAAVEQRLPLTRLAEHVTSDPGRRWRQGGERLAEGLEFETPLVNVAMRGVRRQRAEASSSQRGDGCIGCGLCNYGCRFGQKLSVDRTFLLDCESAGGLIHANHAVDKLIAERTPSGRVRVCGLMLARGGRQVDVDEVVLAGGAIGSAALLLRSCAMDALLSELPCRANVGKGLGFNYGTAVVARFPDLPTRSGDRGIQINYVASKPGDESFILENAFLPPALMASVVPGMGADHRTWMRAYRRLGMAVNTIGSHQSGSIDGSQRVTFRVSPAEMEVIHESLALTVRMYLAAGAEEVGLSGLRAVTDAAARFYPGEQCSPRRLLEKLRRAAPDPSHLMLSSAHPQGGVRCAPISEGGAVDQEFRVHGTENLFVGDASLFPSTIVVNPQWTVMALAHAVAARAERIIEARHR